MGGTEIRGGRDRGGRTFLRLPESKGHVPGGVSPVSKEVSVWNENEGTPDASGVTVVGPLSSHRDWTGLSGTRITEVTGSGRSGRGGSPRAGPWGRSPHPPRKSPRYYPRPRPQTTVFLLGGRSLCHF